MSIRKSVNKHMCTRCASVNFAYVGNKWFISSMNWKTRIFYCPSGNFEANEFIRLGYGESSHPLLKQAPLQKWL